MGQYEAWAVNQRTGEKRLLGCLSYEAAKHHPRAKVDWGRKIWGEMLKSIL